MINEESHGGDVQQTVPSHWTGACSGSDPVEKLLWATRNAVVRFGRAKSDIVARRVRFHARRLKASGIFGGNPRHLWDEYCYYVEEGPTQLDWAWEQAIDPMIDYFAAQLPAVEQVLMTSAQKWEDEDFNDVNDEGGLIDGESLRRSISKVLRSLADENSMTWITGCDR